MEKKRKLSLVAIAVSFFVANQAGAANTWAEARNDAMGERALHLRIMAAGH